MTDTLANLGALTTAQSALTSSSAVDDTVTNILAAQTAHSSVLTGAGAVTAELDGGNISAAQLAALQTLPGMTLHPNATSATLTIADTVQDLLMLTTAQKALVQATTLAGNDSATAAQLAQLAALPAFSHGTGHTLTVADTVANLGALTAAQHALATSVAVDDTLANVLTGLAAHSTVLSTAGLVTIELDGTGITIALAQSLLTLPGLHLHANGGNTSLIIADTMQHLSSGAATVTALGADGAVTVEPTDDHTILTAASAASLISAGLNPGSFTLAVSDTGSALSTVASQIFGQGFEAITVTAGAFAGTMTQLLDPTLHLSGDAIAQLTGSASGDVANAVALSLLPGFNIGSGATLAVHGSMASLIANAAVLEQFAGSILVTDTEIVSAQSATALAQIQATVGAAHFSLGGQFLVVSDTAQSLLGALIPSAVSLATGIGLSSDARINKSQALQFVDMGAKFSPSDFFITIADTASNLVSLASTPGNLMVVNGWGGGATLTADGSLDATDATTLAQIGGFYLGGHHLVISDTADDLLNPLYATGVTLATSVQLSQAATVSAAHVATLASLPGFGLGSHSLTVEDAPSALLAEFQGSTVPFASAVILSDNAAAWIVNAADAARLAGMPGFSAGSAGMQVYNSAPDILAPANAAGVAAASSVLLDAAAVVSVSQVEALEALHGFSPNGQSLTISDTETNLATLDSTAAALATSIQVLGSPDVSVDQYNALISSSAFLSGGNMVVISDTATALLTLVGQDLPHVSSIALQPSAAVPAAQAQSLSALPNLLTGSNLTISDSIANLVQTTIDGMQLLDAAGEQLAAQVAMNADGMITAAQGAMLASLGARFGNGGFHLTLEDTPANLLTAAVSLGPIMSQVTATVLASNGATPWTATLGQAAQLGNLPNFSAGVSGAVIQDSVTNILYPGNATIVGEVPAITLNGNATGGNSVNVAQAEALHGLSNFSLGAYQLNIMDGIGHLAALDAATAAMATSIQLQGSGLASVTQFNTIRSLPNYSNNGKLLVVNDTAANLQTLSGSLTLASEIMLSTNVGGLSAATAEQLASLPGFTTGIASMAIVDSAADLVAGGGSRPDDWAGEMAATSVTLNGLGGAVTAAQADDLALLGGRFSAGGNTLSISDSVANLVAAANAGGVALAGAVTLAGDEAAVSVANWARVSGLANFSKNTHSVTISDGAANLAAAAPALLAAADHVQLATGATLTVAAAEALTGIANFTANAAAPITIADTLPDLLALAANHNAILLASSIELSADALVTVAQLTALAALAQVLDVSRQRPRHHRRGQRPAPCRLPAGCDRRAGVLRDDRRRDAHPDAGRRAGATARRHRRQPACHRRRSGDAAVARQRAQRPGERPDAERRRERHRGAGDGARRGRPLHHRRPCTDRHRLGRGPAELQCRRRRHGDHARAVGIRRRGARRGPAAACPVRRQIRAGRAYDDRVRHRRSACHAQCAGDRAGQRLGAEHERHGQRHGRSGTRRTAGFLARYRRKPDRHRHLRRTDRAAGVDPVARHAGADILRHAQRRRSGRARRAVQLHAIGRHDRAGHHRRAVGCGQYRLAQRRAGRLRGHRLGKQPAGQCRHAASAAGQQRHVARRFAGGRGGFRDARRHGEFQPRHRGAGG